MEDCARRFSSTTALHFRCSVALGFANAHACRVVRQRARVLQGCASVRSRFAFVSRTYAKRNCTHAVRCEVPSPDGAVGREWCYVEVTPLFGCLPECLSAYRRVRCCLVREDDVGGPSSENWARWLGEGGANSARGMAVTSQSLLQGYCAPRVDYGEVRLRVANAYAEKSHEFLEMVSVIQSLSKDIAGAAEALRARCS